MHKKIITIALILFMITATACSNNNNKSNSVDSMAVGVWKEKNGGSKFELYSDHTGLATTSNGQGTNCKWTTINENKGKIDVIKVDLGGSSPESVLIFGTGYMIFEPSVIVLKKVGDRTVYEEFEKVK